MSAPTEATIDSERIEAIFRECLFEEGEDYADFCKGEGVMANVGFHLARLESHRQEIEAVLDLLPYPFREAKGGGWSFLNACYDRNGHHWTSSHQRMEQLFTLGNALGRVKFFMPRELWSTLPGGMPYLVITIKAVATAAPTPEGPSAKYLPPSPLIAQEPEKPGGPQPDPAPALRGVF